MHDMANALCYSANGTEVETVLIDGEIVMEQGKMTLGMFEKGLTYSLRTSIDEYLKRFAPQFRQERELVSSEEPLPGGGMLVRLKALEGERTLLEVDLTVASLEESLALRKNWQQRSAQLYDIIYDTLTKEEK